MTIATFRYIGTAAPTNLVLASVDPAATIDFISEPDVVDITTDDSNQEQLDFIMGLFGFLPTTTTMQPVYRRNIVGWTMMAVAANLTDSPMDRFGLSQAPFPEYLVTRPGNLTGVSALLDTSDASEDLTMTVFQNGVATTMVATVAAGTTQGISVMGGMGSPTPVPISPGDLLDLRISTPVGWTNTTANLSGEIEVEK